MKGTSVPPRLREISDRFIERWGPRTAFEREDFKRDVKDLCEAWAMCGVETFAEIARRKSGAVSAPSETPDEGKRD
jgi:hypothetical protein